MSGCKTVFFVDDDPDEIFLAKSLFQEHWTEVQLETFKNPLTLLEYLKNPRVASPDLIVTDLYMPILDGIELARLLRNKEQYRDVPIVMLTSSACPALVAEAKNAGISYYLKKPPDYRGFIDLVGHLNCWYQSFGRGTYAQSFASGLAAS